MTEGTVCLIYSIPSRTKKSGVNDRHFEINSRRPEPGHTEPDYFKAVSMINFLCLQILRILL